MRFTGRLLASVKAGRFLEAGNPTGLTGLFNHPAPRSTLIYLYSSTLDTLKPIPESSVYRRSTEALTRHRLKIVESIKPAGYEEWAARAKKLLEENPEVFSTPEGSVAHDGGRHVKSVRDGRTFMTTQLAQEPDERLEEWDGEEVTAPELEGTRSEAERTGQADLGKVRPGQDEKQIAWEPEPPLNSDQIAEMENQIGAGLIEEVIQVAEGELKLVGTLAEAKVWEELEEKPADGQWTYFSRGTNTGGTQAP